ncbi:nuclear transport factor 2 family protein [Sphingomonas sp. CL5.1]|uniref:nuclear transport factor 2 family protein n=1 Tax=Sphingomonas sp. CL5.1 TaxID=2653203 RepID=UPI0015819A53|nr:nuclear transport factor 2 family protein [Sphingomonas sp. CL5.1]QKR98319.1 nuclear transport factor 2 family protein [Sphingomonas sp. CL5.1]
MDLEQRVARLEDRAAINDLVVRYFLASDGDDLKTIGESFTPDAIFASSGQISGEGRDGIVEFIRGARSHMGLTIHTPHYVQITFDDADRARGLVGAHLELVLGGQAIYGAVRYVDEYVKRDGRWLISKRDMRTIAIAPWLEFGAALESETPMRWPGSKAQSDYPRSRLEPG